MMTIKFICRKRVLKSIEVPLQHELIAMASFNTDQRFVINDIQYKVKKVRINYDDKTIEVVCR